MVGNDIIDLELSRQQTDWKRKGFLQKVFTPDEQELIHSSDDPFLTVWRTWSMKESAYKLFLQTGQDRFFNPLRLRCEITTPEVGLVKIEKLHINTRSKFHSQFIFTSTFYGYLEEPEHHIINLSTTESHFQSKFTHRHLLKCIALRSNLPIDKMKILKTDQNVPEVFYDGHRMDVSVSLTHHGSYGAYSLMTIK